MVGQWDEAFAARPIRVGFSGRILQNRAALLFCGVALQRFFCDIAFATWLFAA
jgi:hypothetical protein